MMKDLGLIQQEFKRLTLLPLSKRETNKLDEKIYRKDVVFFYLSNRTFDHPRLLIVLKKKIGAWLKLDNSETLFALVGYIYYLDVNFLKAENYFYKCVEKVSENLDNWVDLAFSLYHQGARKNRVAKNILFNLDLFIKKFKTSGYKKCNLITLEKIYKDLKSARKNYAYNWRKYVIN